LGSGEVVGAHTPNLVIHGARRELKVCILKTFSWVRLNPSKLETSRTCHLLESKAACLQRDELAFSMFGDDEGDVVVLLVGAEAVNFVDDSSEG
jgi:hypothetical protein